MSYHDRKGFLQQDFTATNPGPDRPDLNPSFRRDPQGFPVRGIDLFGALDPLTIPALDDKQEDRPLALGT
jgi:hypothetical protein